METPELLFQALQSLAAAKHPSAAMMTTMVSEGMQRAKGGEAAAAMQKKVMAQATSSAVYARARPDGTPPDAHRARGGSRGPAGR